MRIGLAAAWIAAAAVLGAASPPVRVGRRVSFVAHEGSNFSVARSPADGTLLIDLQGSLWTIPARGGAARRITADLAEFMRPDWSPDGRRFVAQSYGDGMWHLWTLAPDGSDRRQLTRGPYDDTAPRWSPDGRRIAFLSTRGGAPAIWAVDADGGGAPAPLVALAAPRAFGWAADGKSLVVADAAGLWRATIGGAAAALPAPCRSGSTPTAPALSPSARRIAYICAGPQYGHLMLRDGDAPARVIGPFDDAFPFPPRWESEDRLLYVADGRVRTLDLGTGGGATIPFGARFTLERAGYRRKRYDFEDRSLHSVRGIVAPALSPDGRTILFKALNDLWLTDRTGHARRLTHNAVYETDAVWSPDGRTIAYADDAAGLMQLRLMDVATGTVRPLTHGGAHASVAPAWSRDGRSIAYQTEEGATRILDIGSGADRALVPPLDFPSRPSWSADGRTIAFTALDESRNRILLVDVASGQRRWIDPAPFRSISTRGDDGPLWSPDGRWLLFSMMSTLWALPVAPDGTPTGPARQLTREASDAPSWAGDSRTIAYLANGRLKLASLDGGAASEVPLHLGWRPAVHRGRLIVHAGRLWDGVQSAIRRNVDILVVDNRIAAIRPHRRHAAGWRVIDASHHTVTPGLFEMHNHQQLRSKYLGDRQGRLWLAYGITSTRSTGDPAYRALEDKEALAAGARIGPRHFMTGEMLEGSRLLWSFSRPVEDEAQLGLELGRARALGYDVLKTYMRFRSDWQVRVARFGHDRLGISTTSHFSFPGIAHGVDGEEHFAGPTRWDYGFPHLFRGNVYDDLFLALGKGRAELTTTNFAGRQSLLELPGLPADPRLEALLPPWEQASLRQFMGCAAHSGPCDFFLTPNEEQSRLTIRDLIRARRGGMRLMVGSDAPLDTVVVSTFQNLYTLQKYGLTPFEALRAATMTPARAQGVARDLGSIAVGKVADLVLVDGRPDRDIRDLMKVTGVMKAGAYRTVASLLAPYSAASR